MRTEADFRCPLTVGRKAQLKALAEMPDGGPISDIPKLTEEFWKNAKLFSKVIRQRKMLVSLRLDADLLAWLKKTGPGY